MSGDTTMRAEALASSTPSARSTWRPQGAGWYVVPLGIYALSRLVDYVLLVVIGRTQVDASRLPLTPGQPPLATGRSYGDLATNWDGQWYRYVVEHGYPTHLPTVDGVVQPNQWAFYPLYPGLVKVVTWTGLSFAVAAPLISLVCGALAMCLLYRMLAPTLGGFGAAMSVLALCVGPAALIWQVAYTESLALLLVLVALWCLRAHRYGGYLVAALALAFARPIALPLAAVAALHWFVRWRRRDTAPFPRRERIGSGLGVVVTAASFLAWPLTAALVTGRYDAYTLTEQSWYRPGSGGWVTWVGGAVQASPRALVVVVPVAVVVLLVLLLRPAAARWGTELRSWSLLYLLFLLASTRPTGSILRYGVLSVIPWWPFPEVGEGVTARRDRVALFVLVLALGIVVQVMWMRWFYVLGPAVVDHP